MWFAVLNVIRIICCKCLQHSFEYFIFKNPVLNCLSYITDRLTLNIKLRRTSEWLHGPFLYQRKTLINEYNSSWRILTNKVY